MSEIIRKIIFCNGDEDGDTSDTVGDGKNDEVQILHIILCLQSMHKVTTSTKLSIVL